MGEGLEATLIAPNTLSIIASSFDLPGALLVTLGLGLLSYGFIDLSQAGPAPLGAAWIVGLAVLTLGLFVLRERNAEGPLLPPWVFTDRNRAGGFSSLLFFSMGNIGIYFLSLNICRTSSISAPSTRALPSCL